MSVDFLVGSSGFVGSNLASQKNFAETFSSKNITDAFGENPGLLVYAGVRSEMFTANNAPSEDLKHIEEAISNIRMINPKRLVLISTIAVYPDTHNADEDTEIMPEFLKPYGQNRFHLEKWCEQNFSSCLIVRLPALFGKNLRKNFIYDFINIIPSLLTHEKFNELTKSAPELRDYYEPYSEKFMKCRTLQPDERKHLKAIFRRTGFTALNFTDSRAVYQFYDLSRLWGDIDTALTAGLRRLNLATPPVSVGRLYNYLTGGTFSNELGGNVYSYDMHTKHSGLFGRNDGYIMDIDEELSRVKKFVEGNRE